MLCDTDRSAASVIEAFRGAGVNILVPEFIKEAGGTDIRAFVIGGKVVAAMRRTGAEGEFRSNLHRGGSAQVVRISPEERPTALRPAKSMGLGVCGVDMLRSNHGAVVMEVNPSPGLEGVEKATGKDIAGMIIQHIEKHAPQARHAPRGAAWRRAASERHHEAQAGTADLALQSLAARAARRAAPVLHIRR